MLNRLVTTALGVAVALFVFEVIWPLFDDDPASVSQTAAFGGGLIVVALLSFIYWRRS